MIQVFDFIYAGFEIEKEVIANKPFGAQRNSVNLFDHASGKRLLVFTYNQGLDRNRYLHNGQLLSATDGNDYDQFSVSMLHWLDNNTVTAGVNFKYIRKGQGKVTDPWTTPWLDVSGDYKEPFPTGVVEKINRISLSAKG